MAKTKSYHYSVVDVFTSDALEGNPLAVFPDASDIDEVTMQKIARELNLAETAFVLPARRDNCAARVRIFTPAKEMVFAGHPTIGTAFVLQQRNRLPRDGRTFLLEEAVGPIPLRMDPGERPLIWLRMPLINEGRHFDPALCAKALGLELQDLLPVRPKLLSAGNPTLVIGVKDEETVDRAWIDLAGLRSLNDTAEEPFCVYLFTPTADGAYSRMFAPEYGIAEDPATGSSIGPLAIFMMRHNLISNTAGTRFISEQGTKMGRRSLLHVEICGTGGADGIYAGGHVTPIVEAVMTLGITESKSLIAQSNSCHTKGGSMKSLLRRCIAITGCCVAMIASSTQKASASAPEPLRLQVFIGEVDSYDVTSTLIYGKTESILVDGQFRISEATKLADQIAATGTHLKAIIITHPDEDHYFGTAILHQRFPDTPIYMTAAALDEFHRTSARYLAAIKAKAPTETPDSVPTPEVLPTTIFAVDGEAVDVIKDVQGDVLKTTNTFVWIPSLRAVIAGDIVFNGVYAWLTASTVETRRAWHESLQLIAALRPQVVIAGHKKDRSFPDSLQAVTTMEKYLNDFDAGIKTSSTADELVAMMKKKYPDWTQDLLLVASAKAAMATVHK